MTKYKSKSGVFRNGITFIRFGKGEKTLLLFSGGPSDIFSKMFLNSTMQKIEPFVEDYTIHIVHRKSGLTQNYTTKDMANDYAEMIINEFGGKVDVILGISYGGLIAQHFAVDHADLFDHIVFVMTAHRISESGKKADQEFAELLSKGKYGLAITTVFGLKSKGFKSWFKKVRLWLYVYFKCIPNRKTFSQDMLIEAKAEMEHDATKNLTKIKIPILILCNDNDPYIPANIVKEMGDLIPESTVILYPAKGHVITDENYPKDILNFIKNN
ncbi:MAG: alpha/beta hydrolase [Candidatus Lokiarchaeota archaeon]|nr:alpha/beta hydrolase [Candidatus Lokiarchaeota archaeon]